jgi:single stranded DNA-binding protein
MRRSELARGPLARPQAYPSSPEVVASALLDHDIRTRRRSGEEWTDKTNYFTVEVSGTQARSCAQYLRKGSRVVVDAELDWREWTDQQDNKREAVTFRARQVLFEGGRSTQTVTGEGSEQKGPPPPAARPTDTSACAT